METDISSDNQEHQPKCFMQRAPLNAEVEASLLSVQNRKVAVLSVISIDRPCESDIPWIQGYSPKEHREMLALADQEARHRHSLFISRVAVAASIAGVIIGAAITWSGARMQVEATMEAARMSATAQRDAAKLDAEAQIRAAQMQIDAQKELSRQPAPPINVTVQIPQTQTGKR